MSKLAKTNLDSAPSIFVGQGDLVMFTKIEDADYASATLASLKNAQSLGQIVQDSTSWEGDDVETTQIKDEQGNLITARVTAGTLAFAFELASTSRKMVQTFLKGVNVSGAGAAFASSQIGSGYANIQVTGFGHELPTLNNIPLAIVNDGQDKIWLYPKCKISSNLSYSDGLWRIRASVVAETVDTANLKTGMIIETVAGA